MARDGFFLMWRSSVGSHSHISCNWVYQGSVLRWPGRDTDVSRTFLARQAVSIVVIVGSLLSTYINICTQVWMCNPACVCVLVCVSQEDTWVQRHQSMAWRSPAKRNRDVSCWLETRQLADTLHQGKPSAKIIENLVKITFPWSQQECWARETKGTHRNRDGHS